VSIIGWIVLGLLAGALAKWILPGRDPGGIVLTMLLGIAGALVGGFMVGLLTGVAFTTPFDLTSLLVATLGAIVVLLLYRVVVSSRS
jgi:uncharacterized membrane protein YeaQ/YmgE (transglycosylase-associated protein family)